MLEKIPEKAQSFLLQDAEKRDTTTARRSHLLRALLRERYLTREVLIHRVEFLMGFSSFGEKSWEDTFYRDMRVVKQAFEEAGHKVKYSRKKEQSGYYLVGKPRLSTKMRQEIAGAIAELDDKQMKIYKKMPAAQKFYQATSIIDLGRKVILEREAA